nr:immunoglobulin heavy chain junction region [Macaca mulatta]MOV88646.1 immunoglobulin heavy chain junction region [Macaca mulatta]
CASDGGHYAWGTNRFNVW